jgi:hypothetical protein
MEGLTQRSLGYRHFLSSTNYFGMANSDPPQINIHSQEKTARQLSDSLKYWVPCVPNVAPCLQHNNFAVKKADISFAIISSYSTSVSWIYEFFNPRTPVILVSQPDPSGRAAIKNVLPNWVMTVPFLRYGRGCQHMKVCAATALSLRVQ